MASRAQSVTISFVAWDTVNNVGKTGDNGNFTLKWIKDGTAATPTNASSEVDATNAPGIYKLTLTGTECTCDVGTLSGKSSTTGIVIIPITITFEQLPAAAPAANGGLPTCDASNNVGITQAAADKAWATATRALTDKANFTLSSTGIQAIWDALTSALTTVGSIGKRLADDIDAAISTRSTYAGADT